MQEAAEITSGRVSKNVEALLESLLHAEHSPVRLLLYWVVARGVPVRATTHIVRHSIGNVFFVSTSRPDLTDEKSGERNIAFLTNHQSLVNMARKRLCSTAWHETRELVREIKAATPEITRRFMVPECVYRGNICHEPRRKWNKCRLSPHHTEL